MANTALSPLLRPRRVLLLALAAAVLASGCASSRSAYFSGRGAPGAAGGQHFAAGAVKDNRPQTWVSDHERVRRLRAHYLRTRTVEVALRRARPYLPTIFEELRQRSLPVELAYLPMLESSFKNRADSGHARGLWQFTRQTARAMGLQVGFMVDERLNWRKATGAAARYLDQLGERFNYNWELALAAYNGGPNYVEGAMRAQRTWNFWNLRLRQETSDYVPRFIAMVQVAKQKYPHLMMATL